MLNNLPRMSRRIQKKKLSVVNSEEWNWKEENFALCISIHLNFYNNSLPLSFKKSK